MSTVFARRSFPSRYAVLRFTPSPGQSKFVRLRSNEQRDARGRNGRVRVDAGLERSCPYESEKREEVDGQGTPEEDERTRKGRGCGRKERGAGTMVKRQVPFAGHATDGPKF